MYSTRLKDWLRRNTNLSNIAFQIAKGAELHPHLFNHYLEELVEAKNRKLISLTPQAMLETYKIELAQRISHRRPLRKRRVAR